MRGSSWDEVLQKLAESFKDKLSEINREDIVKFCLENQLLRNAAEEFLKNIKRSPAKDSALALKKKEEGNEKYKAKNYKESLQLYKESIYYANKDDECLPLAYSNRSLVLQQMGYPSESLIDVDLALDCGYPKPKIEILLLRKAKCLVQLGDVINAEKVLKEALKKSEKKESRHLVENELEKLENLKTKKLFSSEKTLPKPVGGENENFASASKHLSVYYSETKGRHVIATEDIEVGDVLFVEKPFAFVTFAKACFNCGKQTIAPIPCWNCLDVCYCSSSCREDFWKSVHSFECGFAELFESIGIALLSLRIILKASCDSDELKKKINYNSEPVYENGIVIYKSKGYDVVYNLVHNTEKYEKSDLFQYVMTALLLALYLKNHTKYFPAESGDEDLSFLTSVIWRHILQLICNGHAMSQVLVKGTKENLVVNQTYTRTGTAIYTSASMMNHSCEPSIINSFRNNYLIVRASKPIKKGEEVFNCYGPHARKMKRASRQEILSKQYFFQCKCQACLEEFDIQDRFTAFKCTNCKGAVVPIEENSQKAICLNCKQTSDISIKMAEKHNKFYSLVKEGEILLDNDILGSFKKFLEAWWIGRDIFYKFHKDLSYVADEVARLLLDLQDYRRCIMFLKCCVRSVEERFGFFSIELAEELRKLADVYTHYLIEDKINATRELAHEGMLYYAKAERILSLLYGPENEALEEIKTNKGILEALLKRK